VLELGSSQVEQVLASSRSQVEQVVALSRSQVEQVLALGRSQVEPMLALGRSPVELVLALCSEEPLQDPTELDCSLIVNPLEQSPAQRGLLADRGVVYESGSSMC